MPLLQTRSLSYAAGRHPILRHVNAFANAGEVVGLCGPNGAGKSTLLRLLGGALRAREGDVLLHEKSLHSYSPRVLARHIALMHQHTTLDFDFTVREAVLLGRSPYLGLWGNTAPSDYAAVEAALHAADCAALATRRVTALSGGEMQRVMLARALCQDTDILLLDEPTAGLDIHFARQVYACARRLATQGKCVVCVIHDLPAAAQTCHRLYLLGAGQVLADGTPREVLTSENIHRAYGVQAHIYDNPNGEWAYYIP